MPVRVGVDDAMRFAADIEDMPTERCKNHNKMLFEYQMKRQSRTHTQTKTLSIYIRSMKRTIIFDWINK